MTENDRYLKILNLLLRDLFLKRAIETRILCLEKQRKGKTDAALEYSWDKFTVETGI